METIEPAADHLWWAGGQLDGDGCVVCPHNKPTISVGKAIKGYKTLEILAGMFGGVIRLHSAAKGNQQETHAWSLHGDGAVVAITKLEPFTRLKRPQLQEALAIVKSKDQTERQQRRQRIRNLKYQEPPAINERLPDAYFAGFFDADGSLRARGLNGRVVKAAQKWPAVLNAMRASFGGYLEKKKDGGYELGIYEKATAVAALQRLIPHLVEKRDQALILLDMPFNGGQAAEAKLSELRGNSNHKGRGEREFHVQRKRKHAEDNALPSGLQAVRVDGVLVGYCIPCQKNFRARYFQHPDVSLDDKLRLAKEALAKRQEMKRLGLKECGR